MKAEGKGRRSRNFACESWTDRAKVGAEGK